MIAADLDGAHGAPDQRGARRDSKLLHEQPELGELFAEHGADAELFREELLGGWAGDQGRDAVGADRGRQDHVFGTAAPQFRLAVRILGPGDDDKPAS